MKGIDIFCASQASTAICLSMDQASSSSSSSSIIQLGGRAIDRHNPIIRDERRISRALPSAPCSSQSPINPRAYHQLQKSTKKSNSSARQKDQSKSSLKENDQKKKKKKKNSSNSKQEDDSIKKSISTAPSDGNVRRSFAKPLDLITPPGSSRYLLSDHHSVFFDDYDPVLALASFGDKKNQSVVNQEEAINAPKDEDSPSESKPQVVVLRVSLHCKGCEGKVRKHLSRMKGVSSYNIDFAAKKVTVVGDVTPLSVLASVSKVKSAQFWPAPPASAAGPAATNTEIKK